MDATSKDFRDAEDNFRQVRTADDLRPLSKGLVALTRALRRELERPQVQIDQLEHR